MDLPGLWKTIGSRDKLHSQSGSGVAGGKGARMCGHDQKLSQSLEDANDPWRGSLLPLGGTAVVNRMSAATFKAASYSVEAGTFAT